MLLHTILLYSICVRYSLKEIFSLLDTDNDTLPGMLANNINCGDLFGVFEPSKPETRFYNITETYTISGLYSPSTIDLSGLCPAACRLFELSIDAFYAIVEAWMSEFPIETKIISFGRKVFAAAGRDMADIAATDRGDADTRAVLSAAYKVAREIHRLHGFLRFSPDNNGVYTAFCEPDHFVLPAFAGHFKQRFGPTPWAIIDEKRNLRLDCLNGQMAAFSKTCGKPRGRGEEWEELWGHYHKTINNESRKNPKLQQKLIPARYRKNMPEL